MQPKRIAILGVGDRGNLYASLIKQNPQSAQLIAVADPGRKHRNKVAREHNLAPNQIYPDWQSFVANPPPHCDAVIIATPDRHHAAPAIACLNRGQDLLLEKPMGISLEECQSIEAAQRRSGRIVSVCHSLRYHHAFKKVRDLIQEGAIGQLITLDLLEQVELKHQAHSFVRGNWGNQSRSTFMLLAKSCHDLDYLAYLINQPCQSVNSFGHLTYFKKENAPPNSTARCTDPCPIEPTCPFSAIKQYLQTPLDKWPANVTGAATSPESQLEALKTGPYGRCVWKCDNDVVDHQIVSLQFQNQITATFTMTAFTKEGGRKLRAHGTTGELYFDEETITLKHFHTNQIETIPTPTEPGAHGGGDTRMFNAWLTAIQESDPSKIQATAKESLRTHTIAFAAERSRMENRTVNLHELDQSDPQVARAARP